MQNFIKMQLQDDSWITYMNQNNIHKKIQELNPKNIYISVNTFLNYKEHNTYSYQNIPLQKSALIDIDGQNFESKQGCEKYFIEILEFFKMHKIHIQDIVQTNNTIGGFQVLVKPCCRNRMLYHIAENELFRKIDNRVHDDKRVRRYAPSWNGNKNSPAHQLFLPDCLKKNHPQRFSHNRAYFSKDLNTSELKETLVKAQGGFLSPLSSLHSTLGMQVAGQGVSVVDGLTSVEPTILPILKPQANDNKPMKIGNSDRHNIEDVAEIKSNLPPHFLVKEMSSSVYGIKDSYVPVLKFKSKPSRRTLRRLQKAYSLGDIYLFEYHLGYMALCPKISQFRRLEKIYRKAKCWHSLNEISKFKQNWIYISNVFDVQERKRVNTFAFLDFYEGALGNNWHSYPHLLFLKKYIKKQYDNVIGKEPKVYVAEFFG